MTNEQSLGRASFEGYRVALSGQTYDGKSIPSWEHLTDAVRSGWDAGAAAVERLIAARAEDAIPTQPAPIDEMDEADLEAETAPEYDR